jgi:hypothetical protein
MKKKQALETIQAKLATAPSLETSQIIVLNEPKRKMKGLTLNTQGGPQERVSRQK